jgi:glycosyltransferase involved in cell wall biosynthesis
VKKKKILILIDWYLPGYKAGGPIQSVSNLVEHLKSEFDFLIITRNTDYCETTPYPNIKSNEWNDIEPGVQIYYFSEDQLTRNNVRNIIRKTEFDNVYLNGIYSYYFTLLPLVYLRKKHNKRIIIASRGMLSEGSLNVKKAKKKFFIRAVKVLKLFDSVLFHATTEAEKNEIREVFGERIEVRTAANLPQKIRITVKPDHQLSPNVVKLVNIARIAPEKNLLFALQILKLVKVNVLFDFYGPIYNQEYWTECKSALDDLPQNVKANYKGSIESERVLDTLKKYDFMFMPTTGENFGHIILQALSVGCPVIISDQTPWKKLPEKNIGWDLSLEDKEKFAEIIESCAEMSQDVYDEISYSAFDYARKYINDQEIVEQNRCLFI